MEVFRKIAAQDCSTLSALVNSVFLLMHFLINVLFISSRNGNYIPLSNRRTVQFYTKLTFSLLFVDLKDMVDLNILTENLKLLGIDSQIAVNVNNLLGMGELT